VNDILCFKDAKHKLAQIMLMSSYEYSVFIHLHAVRYTQERRLKVSWLLVDVAMEKPELTT